VNANDMTHDQMVAEALTGNPEPLRHSLGREADEPTPTAVNEEASTAADRPATCSSCHGTGMVTSAPWRDWYEHQNREIAGGVADAAETRAFDFDWPDAPEEVECDDCSGTGEYEPTSAEAVDADAVSVEDERTRTLRAGLTVAARMAKVEFQAARDDGSDAELRWEIEQRAAEHQLAEMVNGDPQQWWDHATPAQICDAFRTAKATQGDHATEAGEILAAGLKDRYGIDVVDLDPGPDQLKPADATTHEAGWQRFAADIERDMATRWPDVAHAHGWADTADRRDQLADQLDQTADVHTRLAGREDAMVRMSYALRAALEGDTAEAARHFDHASNSYKAAGGRYTTHTPLGGLRADIWALLDTTPRDEPARPTADSAARGVTVDSSHVVTEDTNPDGSHVEQPRSPANTTDVDADEADDRSSDAGTVDDGGSARTTSPTMGHSATQKRSSAMTANPTRPRSRPRPRRWPPIGAPAEMLARNGMVRGARNPTTPMTRSAPPSGRCSS